jgi:predicted permease
MMMQPHIEGRSWLENRQDFNAWIAGRFKHGISAAQAEADLRVIAAQMGREHRVQEGMTLTLSPPGIAGATGRGPTRAFAMRVMLLALLVLLAACANLAALQTARGLDRQRELGVRLSIGATRGRLARQLVTESVTLSLLGGLAGVTVAVLLLRLLSRWQAPLEFPVQFDVTADWRVLLFAFSIVLATGLLLGFGLARRVWSTEPALAIQGAAQIHFERRVAWRDIMLPLQIALSCVLVTASLVGARGLLASLQSPLGFAPDGVAVAGYDLAFTGYDRTRGTAFHERLVEDLAQMPGVESAAYASSVPLSIDQSTTTVFPEDTIDFSNRNSIRPSYYNVSSGYFHTIGTRLLAGREFTPRDNEKVPRVAVVNQTFARRVIGTADAVGRRFRIGRTELVEVVGIVEDGKYEALTEATKAAVFFPALQAYSSSAVAIARSNGSTSQLVGEMRRVIARHNPSLAVYGVGSLREILGFVLLPLRTAAVALGVFGILAIMVAVTGIYGVSSYTVSRRAKEIGIRVAVGAAPAQVLAFVFRRLAVAVALGMFVGLTAAFASANVLEAVVASATSRDPLVIGGTIGCMMLASLAAGLGPARDCIHRDPLRSLRQN